MNRRRTVPLAALALLAFTIPAMAAPEAAVPPPASTTAEASPPADAWIAPEDIADRADALSRILEAGLADLSTTTMLARIQAALDAAGPTLDEAIGNAEVAIREHSSLMAIQDARRQVEGAAEDIPAWQEEVSKEAKRLTGMLENLEQARGTWARTLPRPDTVEAGEAVVKRVERSVASIDDATKHLTALRANVLTLGDRLVDRSTAVRETLGKLEEATRTQGTHLVVPNRPPLWKRGLETALPEEWKQAPQRLDALRKSTREYIDLDARPFVLQALTAVVLMLLFRHLPEMIRRRDLSSLMSESSVRLLSRPYAMAVLLAILPTPAFHPSAPRRVTQLIGIVALLPVARVLMIASRRTSLLLYAGLLLMLLADRLSIAMSGLPSVSLLIFLFEIATGWALARVHRRQLLADGKEGWLTRALAFAQWGLAVSLVAEIGGWSSLAGMIGRLVLVGGLSGILVYAATISIEALAAFALASPLLRNSRFVDRNQDLVQRWSATGLQLAGFLYWMKLVLRSLGLTDIAGESLDSLLAAGLTVGALSISLGGTLAFALTLVASMLVSRIVHEVLEDEIFPRANLPRGIPHALLALSRYTIWSLGFLLSLAAAGVQMGQLAILMGGLGVGIGLGLQDVVKNFAAGITLLLERRVHVGDAVQIPGKDVFGRVLSIGIRASVVRNWNGTEVVMPNDDLVSGTVTNWTLSDRMHRLEVPVGVSYGVEPQAVIDLLLGVAAEAPYLLKTPPPTALFKGFGESSLDFVLRGWTDEDYERTGARTSELGLAVHRALCDGGIEIPFPQRDVNLVQVSPAASAALRGEGAKP